MANWKVRLLKTLPVLYDILAIRDLFRRGERRKRTCNICCTEQIFRFFGYPPRLNSICPNCEALDRHRLIMLYLEQEGERWHGKDMLHFAPESCFGTLIAQKCKRYVGCDYNPRPGQVKVDIERIAFAESTFDLILCSNVLEHVDDKLALSELYRVLRGGGSVLLLFPIVEGWDQTYEDPSVVSEQDRLMVFGQEDHLRFYGRDVRDRIRAAGFQLSEFTAEEPDVSRLGLVRGEKIFICTK